MLHLIYNIRTRKTKVVSSDNKITKIHRNLQIFCLFLVHQSSPKLTNDISECIVVLYVSINFTYFTHSGRKRLQMAYMYNQFFILLPSPRPSCWDR